MVETTNCDNRTDDQPLADNIDTIVVDPNDVLDAVEWHIERGDVMRENHVLRVTLTRSKFNEIERAEPYIYDPSCRYPDNGLPDPIHIDPFEFLDDRVFRNWMSRSEIRRIEREENDHDSEEELEERVDELWADQLDSWRKKTKKHRMVESLAVERGREEIMVNVGYNTDETTDLPIVRQDDISYVDGLDNGTELTVLGFRQLKLEYKENARVIVVNKKVGTYDHKTRYICDRDNREADGLEPGDRVRVERDEWTGREWKKTLVSVTERNNDADQD